jgi:transketolase
MDENVDLHPLKEKLNAFNWQVLEMDGNDITETTSVLQAAKELSGLGPVAVIARTVKGRGVSFMENQFSWHGKVPNDEQLVAAIKELEAGVQT